MLLLPVIATLTIAQTAPPAAAAQNPSPMVEETRAHERLPQKELAGVRRAFGGPAGKHVELLIPPGAQGRDTVDLVIHFHGAAWLPQQAASSLDDRTVAAVVNMGSGWGTYHRAFADPLVFDSLLNRVSHELAAVTGTPRHVGSLTLAGFSAGHGAIRAILREPRHFARVDAVLLLDGMHTSYVPEGKVVAEGGGIDTTNLVAFAEFARAAMRGEKRFLVTHSEIFPGTFASTTETANWLLRRLGLGRTPVLRWGPRGMQQLSESRAGGFELLGFAGNSAPDHVDHLHSMPELLARVHGWRPLFDGRSLAGWRGLGYDSVPTAHWRVVDGAIAKIPTAKVPRQADGQPASGGDLMTIDAFRDFELAFEWRVAPGANSGVKYNVSEELSLAQAANHAALGFEYQVLDDVRHPDNQIATHLAGSLYDILAPSAVKRLRPVGDWNSARIILRGNHGEHWLNGAKVVEFDLGTPRLDSLLARSKYKPIAGFADRRRGHIVLQDHGDEVYFRSIRIRELNGASR
ncbi:MAG: 3-keto-disaccharide hydrolase [Gemmatimonadaceae bacterium]